MKLLVAGANGQVGFKLAQLLKEKGFDFIALTREQLDISDAEAVRQVVLDYLPEVIINAAAYTSVDKAESDQDCAYQINAEGPKNLALAAKEINAAIFHISTDYVFDGNASSVYTEDDITNPQGAYGASKLAGEKCVRDVTHKHIILRTAWVFCEHGNNFVKTMIRLGRDRKELGIVADQYGGPTYAGHIAEALIAIAERYQQDNDLPWGIYHYSGVPHVNWYDFAKSIFNEVQSEAIYNQAPSLKPIATEDYPTPAKRPKNSRMSCEKIKVAFDIAPSNWRLALKNIKAYV